LSRSLSFFSIVSRERSLPEEGWQPPCEMAAPCGMAASLPNGCLPATWTLFKIEDVALDLGHETLYIEVVASWQEGDE
jgi:hypothetical protein